MVIIGRSAERRNAPKSSSVAYMMDVQTKAFLSDPSKVGVYSDMEEIQRRALLEMNVEVEEVGLPKYLAVKKDKKDKELFESIVEASTSSEDEEEVIVPRTKEKKLRKRKAAVTQRKIPKPQIPKKKPDRKTERKSDRKTERKTDGQTTPIRSSLSRFVSDAVAVTALMGSRQSSRVVKPSRSAQYLNLIQQKAAYHRSTQALSAISEEAAFRAAVRASNK